MNDENYCQGFAPIIPDKPKLMILGTMPSVKSLEQAFYYAHPRNAFWPIFESIYQVNLQTDDEKIAFCKSKNILLWDVLKACERVGSLDSDIRLPEVNDFESIFGRFPDLKTVLFNGQKAQLLFRRHVEPNQNIPDDICFQTMPSTSPANARLTFENKRDFWQAGLIKIL